VIDQSDASLDRLFRKSSKIADEAADVLKWFFNLSYIPGSYKKKLVEQVIVEVIIVKLNEYCFSTNLTKHT
jgi:hypothetical protein